MARNTVLFESGPRPKDGAVVALIEQPGGYVVGLFPSGTDPKRDRWVKGKLFEAEEMPWPNPKAWALLQALTCYFARYV